MNYPVKIKGLVVFVFIVNVMAGGNKLKSLEELINKQEPGWGLVRQWISSGKNKIEIGSVNRDRADRELLEMQVSTRSPLGAIIYETSGISIDNGWLRIHGSGNETTRGIIEWNKGKYLIDSNSIGGFLLVADDVAGGFYAINGGRISSTDLGNVFYLSPDNLKWELVFKTYSDFLVFAFSGNLNKYYSTFRWKTWLEDLKNVGNSMGYSFYPFLWTKEGKNVENNSRKIVPIEEIWSLNQDMIRQLMK